MEINSFCYDGEISTFFSFLIIFITLRVQQNEYHHPWLKHCSYKNAT